MSNLSEDSDKIVNPKSYIRQGFWVSIGIAGGFSVLALSIIGIILARHYIQEVPYLWKNIWYSKEQKDFLKCFSKENKIFLNSPLPSWEVAETSEEYVLPKLPAQICKEKGLKPFPPYDQTSYPSSKN